MVGELLNRPTTAGDAHRLLREERFIRTLEEQIRGSGTLTPSESLCGLLAFND